MSTIRPLLAKLAHLAGPLIGLLLFIAAGWVLHQALAEYRYADVVAALQRISNQQIALAVLLTALSYGVLTGYDLLALRYVGQDLAWPKISFAAIVSYAFSNSIGLSVLTAMSVRYRLYSSWGLSPLDIAKVVMFCALTLWLGLLSLGGGLLLLAPLPLPSLFHLPFTSGQPLGAVLLLPVAGYLLLCMVHRRHLEVRNWALDIPPPPLALAQLAIGALDWAVAGAVLYLLLPATDSVGFSHFLSVYLLAQTIGLVSHVPGGLGVFESVVLLLLQVDTSSAEVFGALLAYRLIYYLLPLVLATACLALYETRRHTHRLLWLPRLVGPWIPVLLPQVLALMALLSGTVLLVSGATPTVPDRLDWLELLVPLPLLEASHFIGSLAGIGLLLLARGLQRRLDVAWWLAVLLLLVGIVASLLKGVDYEEALILSVLLAGLLPARAVFYRKSALLDEPFTAGWVMTIAVVLLSTFWLGLFSYKHVDYAHELWWQFSFEDTGDASRFLRAMVGVMTVVLAFAVAKLLHPAPARVALPAAADLDQAQAVVAASSLTYAHLALLGDKALLFNPARTAFLMYGMEGRTWVAMGDPVAATLPERRELAWTFRELCERHDGWTVFYQVHPNNLDLYVELGLTLLKIGEEARVPLTEFSLEGRHRKSLRGAVNRVSREGLRFEIIPASGVAVLLPQLVAVSNAWLGGKTTREKGFSLGFFQADYLQRCPLAVVWQGDRLVAFANLWQGADREELSVDLMRYWPDTPAGLMDYLFVQLMLWGKAQGYRWFNLGMAPLAGLQSHRLAPLWNRFGALVFGHGERLYNFQGLHQYKDKFAPVWEPRYLAAQGGIALPRVLTDLTVLIAGGIGGVIQK